MQDGLIIVKLSYLPGNISKSAGVTDNPQRSNSVTNLRSTSSSLRSSSSSGFAFSYNYPLNTTSAQKIICYVNGRSVIFDKRYDNWKNQYEIKSKKIPQLESDRNLYQVSKAEIKNIDTNTDQLLLRICSLIQDYRL